MHMRHPKKAGEGAECQASPSLGSLDGSRYLVIRLASQALQGKEEDCLKLWGVLDVRVGWSRACSYLL